MGRRPSETGQPFDFKEWWQRVKEKRNAKRRERYALDPEYREQVLLQVQSHRAVFTTAPDELLRLKPDHLNALTKNKDTLKRALKLAENRRLRAERLKTREDARRNTEETQITSEETDKVREDTRRSKLAARIMVLRAREVRAFALYKKRANALRMVIRTIEHKVAKLRADPNSATEEKRNRKIERLLARQAKAAEAIQTERQRSMTKKAEISDTVRALMALMEKT